MKIVEVKHPLIQHKVGLMRAKDVSTKHFRELAKEVGSLLTYEASSEFELEEGKYYCGFEVEKMSKSKYNVVNPDEIINKYIIPAMLKK